MVTLTAQKDYTSQLEMTESNNTPAQGKRARANESITLSHPSVGPGEYIKATINCTTYDFTIERQLDGIIVDQWSSTIKSEMHQHWVNYIRTTHDYKRAHVLRDRLMPYLCASVSAQDYENLQTIKPN